jgi:hypothetical protein
MAPRGNGFSYGYAALHDAGQTHRIAPTQILNNRGITKRCTGVAAGGFSVFRASTGRNPVNAIVRHLRNAVRMCSFSPANSNVNPQASLFQYNRIIKMLT